MECKFRKSRNREKRVILLDGQKILKSKMFRYLKSIIHKIGETEDYVFLRIRARWMKGRSTSRVSRDRIIPIKLKDDFNMNVIRPDRY